MKTLVLLFLTILVSLTVSTSVKTQTIKPVTLKLTQDVLRQEVWFPGEKRDLNLCNLKKGEQYSILIVQSKTCHPALQLPGKKAAHEVTFVATGDCQSMVMSRNPQEKDCGERVWLTIVCTTCEKEPGSPEFPPNMTVAGGQTAQNLIQNVFIGGGCFDISNVTSMGDGSARGTFANGTPSINVATGVILSTGNINNAPGPNNANNAGNNLPGGGYDPDLDQLTTGSITDVVGIQFDFVPTLGTINFDYVFASEEYCEYVGTQYNDVFGFFISGPGITGPFSNNAANIAVLPGGTTAVAINNVNHITNSAYFVPNQNTGNNNCGAVTNMTDIQFDGWTTVLTAVANVIPCSTYHIKLVICDVADAIYDSAVFLKANSFSAGGTGGSVANSPTTSSNLVYESCNDGSFIFTRVTGNINQPLTITFTISPLSTATLGVDYAPFPLTITIPAGQTTFTLPITVFNDNIIEGLETLIITLTSPCSCSSKDVTMQINDPPQITAALTNQEICAGNSATLNPGAGGGIPPLTYLWSNGSTNSSITVSPPSTTAYTVTVSGQCGGTATASATVNVIPAPTATISGTGVICQGSSGTVDLTITFTGTGPWKFVYTINGVPQPAITTSSNPYILTVNQTGTFGLESVSTTTGNCPGTVSGSSTVTTPVITPSATTTPANCGLSNGGVNLSVAPAGTYTYNWSNGATTEDLTNVPGGSYTVTVTGSTGCTSTATYSVANNTITFTVTGNTTPNTACSSGTGTVNTSVAPSGTYTYTWSNSSTNSSLSDLPPGTYTVTVSAGGNCTQTASFTVTDQPNNPTAQISSVPSSCDLANGGATVNAAGGVSPYTYNWSNGATTPGITNVLSGSYTVTVTGANGCTTTATTNVSNVNPPINVTGSTTPNTSCNSSSTGTVNITIVPTGSYTYTWSNGGSGTSLSNLPPGAYTVTVSAGGTCTQVASFTVPNQPNNPNATIAPVQSTCNLANGSAALTVSGGVSPYTFLWSNGETTQNLANILAGSYTVTVTGANGCTTTASTSVANNNPPITVTGTPTPNTACNASPTGGINISASPAGNYTYTWSNGANGTILTNLPPGTYTVTVSAGGTCTQVASFTVPNQPNLPNASISPVTTTCDLANGGANLSVSGGVSPYTFLWSNGETMQNITNILAGSYTVTVTGANGCTTTASTSVANNNPPINVTGTPTPNTSCDANPTGSLTINVTPPGSYTYTWSNGGSGTSLTNLPPGTYTVTVSAGGTCTQVASFTVPNQPNLPNASISPVTTTCDLANGGANLSVSGGVSPYTFLWSNGETMQNITNILAGSYTVTVTGANGCTTTASTSVANNNPPITVTGTPTPNTACNANPTGGINISASPAGNYTYTWSNGANGTILTNLPPGTYTVTVSAGGTCTQVASFTVPNQPNNPTVTTSLTAANCGLSNGNASISVSGGVSPFTYSWSNGNTTTSITDVPAGTYSVTVTGANGCTSAASVTIPDNPIVFTVSGTPTANTSCNSSNGSISINVSPPGNYTYTWSNGGSGTTLNNLPPGGYTVTVSAGGTCTQVISFTVPNLPNNPNASITPTQSTCDLNNGIATLSVTGGVTPYTYLWSNGANTPNLIGVLAGSYTVTVTGANGCTTTASTSITNNNPPIVVTGTSTPNTACNVSNGTISISASPPGNYSYTWSNGATGTNLNNLPPGVYNVTVSAGGSCTQIGVFSVVNQPSVPAISQISNPSTCGMNNGSASVSVSGSTTPYTYLWSNGNTGSGINNVPAGTYTVTVTGANGCSSLASVNITNNNPPMTVTGVTTPNTSCTTGNGTIQVTVVPGGVLSFNWSNGTTGPNPTGLLAGNYTVTVSAGGTCTETASFTIPNNASVPNLSAIPTPSTCNLPNGATDLTVTGGITPYTYLWSNGATTQDLNNIIAGSYTVTVTAQGSCTAVTTVNIPNNNPPLTIGGVTTGNSSCASPNGQISLDISPPGAYTYIWSTGQTTSLLLNLGPGTYTVTVSAGGSCTQVAPFTVYNLVFPPNASTTSVTATCGLSNGSATVTASGGSQPYSYFWANGSTSQTLANVPGGSYPVTVTDANGCTAVASATVANNNPGMSINGTPTANTSCAVNNGAVSITVSPAGSYTYNWSNSATTQNLSNLAPGTYTVTVTAGPTCTSTANFTVANNAAPPNISSTTTPSSCNLTNGSANITISGGATPYTFIWSNGATSEDISNVASGPYSVTVSGANGCTSTAALNIANNNIAINITGTPVANTSCVASNGSVSINITPAASYTYAWSNGTTTQNLSNLAAGSYTVTVSAGGSCTSSATFTVANNTSDPVISQNITAAICGQSNGGIDLTVSGVGAPFQYIWSNAATTEDLTNILPGNYTVTVTGANGCNTSATFNVPNNSSTFSLSGNATPLTSCVTTNGAVNLTITPAGTYAILWSNSATTEDLTGVVPGTYTVTVTESGACTASASFVVANQITYPATSQTIATDSCGLNLGGVNLTVTGGATPYTYNWTNGATTQDLTNIAAGSYAVTVTGANGCTATTSASVPDNSVSFSLNGITVANSSCAVNNGGVDLTVSPAGAYSYTWSNGTTTQDLNGITGGNYSVTVSAGGTCINSATYTVGDDTDSPDITDILAADFCSQNTGGINLTASGSVTPYTFLWSNGATSEDLANIAAGNYSVTVTGANGCAATDAFTVPTSSVTLTLTGATTANTSCAVNNGAVNINVTPVGTYTYLWSNGTTTQSLSGIAAGLYSVTVSAGGSCTAAGSFNVPDNSDGPSIAQNITPAVCGLNNGGINLTVTGGTTPYIFLWSNGASTEDLANVPPGDYTINITDANGCKSTVMLTVPNNSSSFSLAGLPTPNTSCAAVNGAINLSVNPAVPATGSSYTFVWSNSATSEDVNNLASGSYTVTVSEGNTCSASASFTVTNNTNSPVLSQTVSPTTCLQSNGSINLSVSGGTTPYVFLWSNGATSEDLSSIASGDYLVTVTDANSCTATASINVPNTNSNYSLSGIASPNTSCTAANGSIDLGMSPTGTYNYLWSNGATTQDISNLAPATYTVTVTDVGGCKSSINFVVPNNIPTVLVSGSATNILCFGNNNGSIVVSVNGGTSPLNLSWTPSIPGNPQNPSGLAAGNYSLLVTDANGCTGTANFTITQPASALQINCTQSNTVSIPGASDGSGSVTINGGTAPYKVTWSPGGTQSNVPAGVFPINNLSEGLYSVIVTDANGCTVNCGFAITSEPCETQVGTMSSSLLAMCGVGCQTAVYNNIGQFLDGDDVLQFILHIGNSNIIVGEIARNSVPSFCFDPAKMSYGVTYYISAVVGDNDGTGNVNLADYCTVVSIGTPIVFNLSPVASVATPDPVTCADMQVGVTGSSSLPNSTYIWTASGGGSIIGSSTQPGITAGSGGNYTLIVSAAGCKDTTVVQVADIRTQVQAFISANPDQILDCTVTSVVLTGSATGSTNPTFLWINSDVIVSNQNPLVVDYSGVFDLIVIDTLNFCGDTAQIEIIDNGIYPPLFVNPAPQIDCKTTVSLLSGGSSVSGIVFTWIKVNGTDTTIIGNGPSVQVTQPGTYYLVGIDPDNGCKNSMLLTVNGNIAAPSISVGPDKVLDCHQTPVTLTGTGSPSNVTYLWTVNQPGIVITNPTSPAIVVDEEGIYTLTITNPANSCTATGEVGVQQYANVPQGILNMDPPSCYGYSDGSVAVSVDPANGPYQIKLNGKNYGSTSFFAPMKAGEYALQVTDGQGCVWETTFYLQQPEPIVVSLGADLLVELGEEVTIQAQVSIPLGQLDTILWTPDSLPCLQMPCDVQQFTPLNQMNVGVTVIDTNGCKATDKMLLVVAKDRDVYIPNTFSPNGDGTNDIFLIYAGGDVVKVKKFLVFDRWGETVYQYYNFEPNNPAYGWDGKHRGEMMNPQVFVYFAVIEFIDGSEKLFEGGITLMR